MPKHTLMVDLLKKVARTDGFTVGPIGVTAKIINLADNRSFSVHTSINENLAMVRNCEDIERLTGWTEKLFEAQQAAKQKTRANRSKAVSHRLNAALEQMGVFQTPSERGAPVITDPEGYRHESGETMTVEDIGPELARKYLDTVTIEKGEDGRRGQRRASAATIRGYADKMSRGEWVRIHSPIAFADDHLVDGQQRMAAVELSGTTQSFWVARGFTRAIFPKTDKGRNRTANDTFFVEGEDNGAQLVPVMRYTFLMDHVPQKKWPDTRVSDEQLLQTLEVATQRFQRGEGPDPRGSVKWHRASRTSRAQGSAISTAHFLISRANYDIQEGVESFFDVLRFGDGLVPGDPLRALRLWLAAAPERRTKEKNLKVSKQLLHLYLILLQWNNTVEGKKINGISYQLPIELPQPHRLRRPVPRVAFVSNP